MKSVAENPITSLGQVSAVSLDESLRRAWECLRCGDFSGAETLAERALSVDFEEPRVIATLKCAVFWLDRSKRLADIKAPEQRGDFLLKELAGFEKRFLPHLDCPLQEGVDSVCQYVYQTAAAAFVAQLPFEDEGLHPKLLVKAARSLKSNGDFDQALARLEQALALQKDEPSALAEMADCFEMTNESRKAKLLFREAFYLGACAIEVETLRSQMLREVLDSMEGYGYSAQESREWLAVHSVIQGAFSVKRELKPLEVGHLKQAINTLKTEVQAKTPNRNLLVPRLINKYFWLIDHYLSVKEDRSKIEDILLNIKLLDPRIHELYTH